MNKFAIALLTAAFLAGCGQTSSEVNLQVEDLEDYIDWKDDQEDIEIDPFKAKPIFVNGTGTVRAAPDIAVLTGIIKSEAKVEYKAMDSSAKVMNRIQEIIDGKDIKISFTNLSGAEQRDLQCLAHNNEASRRHSDINNDNWFNKREKNRPEDVRQKLREPKKRIVEKVCEVTHVENYIVFTAWVRPSGEVSDYIRAFTEAGVEQVSLFGFDFSNYDELYKEASVKAVKNAREKAEISARIAGTQLTTIESFVVSATERRSRFGQQAMIISPHGNRSAVPQQRIAFSDRVIRSQGTPRNRGYRQPQPAPQPVVAFAPPPPLMQAPPNFSGTSSDGFASSAGFSGSGVPLGGRIPPIFETVTETVVVQEASSELITIPATFETVYETVVVQEASGSSPAVTEQIARRVVKTPARTTERTIPAVSKNVTRRVLKNPGSANNGGGVSAQTGASNALNESMMSGSKTIRVTASVSYNYETPLDGVIFKVPEAE